MLKNQVILYLQKTRATNSVYRGFGNQISNPAIRVLQAFDAYLAKPIQPLPLPGNNQTFQNMSGRNAPQMQNQLSQPGQPWPLQTS